jgi:stage II sporulation protein AA (anti-sigma F factor antagonist)
MGGSWLGWDPVRFVGAAAERAAAPGFATAGRRADLDHTQGGAVVTSQVEEPVSQGEVGLLVEVERAEADTTVRLRGDLDVESAVVLWRRLDDFEPTATVTLEVEGLGFVDSSGLGCLFKLHRRVADVGGMVVVTGASPALRRLMETTGLNRLVAILPT